ncbi:MAG TPA: 2,3-diaminopropionate biosynthesis protein SbnA [Solirubrobacterales bacterium]|nr:2,3-diaminopropionate biosynthesis protein SbnA [Solirubrobacterales bacterium]
MSAGSKDSIGFDVIEAIGNTPLVSLRHFAERQDVEVWAKLESLNPGGSSKDRSAARMIEDALSAGLIEAGSTVIESTSGNLGVGLAQACLAHDLSLICVVDSRTDETKLLKMRDLGADVRVVTQPDAATGDLLVARLELVKRLVAETPGAWRPDQYSNPSNPAAHRETMAEIDTALDGQIDWLFVATSTTGTLRGCCDYLSEMRRQTKVVAVDAIGSVLFGGTRSARRLPGLGAGVATELSRHAWFDRLVRVSELECVVGCRRLMAREGIFAGASSGGAAMALESLAPTMTAGARCAMIFPDGGEGYLGTVYDDGWVKREFGVTASELSHLTGLERGATPTG